MSAAKKCDRCGDYYDGYANYIYNSKERYREIAND